MAVCYAMFSALFGTLSVVFAKLLAKLVEFHFGGVNVFGHWYTYITLAAWLVLMIFWLYRLNAALGLYNPIFIIPLLQANFIFFAIVSGGIYFQEFNYMEKLNWIGFVSGVVSMFTGIFLLVPPKPEVKENEIKESPGSVETHHRRVFSPFIEGGINKEMISMIFNTGPARMFEERYSITAELEKYAKGAEKEQMLNNLSPEKKEWMKEICIN